MFFWIFQEHIGIKASKLAKLLITKETFEQICQPEKGLVTTSRPFLFFVIMSIKRAYRNRDKVRSVENFW